MSNIYTVQAVIVATSGRLYKSQPRELRDGLELDDYKQGLRSDLRMGQYPIDFVNELGHEQVIMPAQVETIIFNVLGVRPEHSFQEPMYEQLREQWQADLRGETKDGQQVIVDHKLEQDRAVVKVTPIVPQEPGSAASTIPVHGNTQTVVHRFGPPRTPDPKVYDMANEETQEMPLPRQTNVDEKNMATKAVERVTASVGGPGKAQSEPRATRSGQRAARPGKLPRS